MGAQERETWMQKESRAATFHKKYCNFCMNVPLYVVPAPGNLSKAMAEKVDSKKGRMIYTQRIAIVDPVFANIETHKGMSRFTLREEITVNIQ